MKNKWKNKTAVITGASSGIGYALSCKLIALGMKVYCLSSNVPEEKIKGVKYLKVDIASETSVKKSVRAIRGKINVLFNNAGVMRRGHFWDTSEKDFDLVMDVNLKGVWHIYKFLWKRMVPKAILMQTNTKNSLLLKESTFAYSLAKRADLLVDDMVKKSHPSWRFKHIHLGPVDTALEWTGYSPAQKRKKMKETITPDQAADLMLKLLDSDSEELIYNNGKYKFLKLISCKELS